MPVVIVMIVFGSFLGMMAMLLSHSRKKMLMESSSKSTALDDNSLPVSELEKLIAEAVQEAVEPLTARLDELDSVHLLEASRQLLLEEDADETVPMDARSSGSSTTSSKVQS